MESVLALALMVLGVCWNYTGLSFIGGFLFPSLLSPVYEVIPSPIVRMLCAVLPFMGIGNYLMSQALAKNSAIAAPAGSVAAAFSLIVIAVMVRGTKVDWEVICAATGLICFALWLSISLQRT